EPRGPHAPLHGVGARAPAPPVGRHLVPTDERALLVPPTPDVRGEDEDLGTEAVGDLADELRPGDGGGVDPDLVGATAEQAVDVLDGPRSPADGERDEDLLGGAGHDVVGRRAVAAARRDVEEGQLVGPLPAVATGELDGVAGVAEVLEVHSLDHPARVDVEAGDDTDGEGHAGSLPTGTGGLRSGPMSISPLRGASA